MMRRMAPFCSPVGGAKGPADANAQIVRTGGVVAADNMAWRQVQPLLFLSFLFVNISEWPGEGQGQAPCIRISDSKALLPPTPHPDKSLFRFVSWDLLTFSCLYFASRRVFWEISWLADFGI